MVLPVLPILAGLGALACMSNPRRRRKRRNPNGGYFAVFRSSLGTYLVGIDQESTDPTRAAKFPSRMGAQSFAQEARRHYKQKHPQYKSPGYKVVRLPASIRAFGLTNPGSGFTAPWGSREIYKGGKIFATIHRPEDSAGSPADVDRFAGRVLRCMKIKKNPMRCNPRARDLEIQNFLRGDINVAIETWRNAAATAFISVHTSGPLGVKVWEAKSQGPSAGGYHKPTQAAENVYKKITGKYGSFGGGTSMYATIADAAAEALKARKNPRRRGKKRKR